VPIWNPVDLLSPSQARNPVIPFAFGSRIYIATQDGKLRAVDTTTGAVAWTQLLSPASATGAPAGIFSAFGGEHDAIFEGTSAANDNVLAAFDPATGAPMASFGFPGTAGIGPITGMPVVDYSRSPQNRVYFASRQGSATETLWCVQLGPGGTFTPTLRWRVALGNISGSPVMRGDRIYVGTDAGEVVSVRADDGLDARIIPLGDGPVRGFVFPDRASGDVYVSTNTRVWRLTDTAGGWVNPLGVGIGIAVPNPSIPLLWPGTTHVYVGGGDGRLYQIQTTTGTVSATIALDYDPTGFNVGAPSLDLGHDLVIVGSERGTFYAVEVPLP
jgi:outer membrane protein assembly factor BamB